MDAINLWIYINDKFNIPDQAWTELTMNTTDIPNGYQIKETMQELNAKWKLKPTPSERKKVRLPWRIGDKIGDLEGQETIRVKMSGNGTKWY